MQGKDELVAPPHRQRCGWGEEGGGALGPPPSRSQLVGKVVLSRHKPIDERISSTSTSRARDLCTSCRDRVGNKSRPFKAVCCSTAPPAPPRPGCSTPSAPASRWFYKDKEPDLLMLLYSNDDRNNARAAVATTEPLPPSW